MIERIGFPLVLFSMLTIVLVETNIWTTGIIITIGLNVAMVLVLFQTIGLFYGFTKSVIVFYRSERYPLYSPMRVATIQSKLKIMKKES